MSHTWSPTTCAIWRVISTLGTTAKTLVEDVALRNARLALAQAVRQVISNGLIYWVSVRPQKCNKGFMAKAKNKIRPSGCGY